jgi:hypothetical protein
MCLSKARHSFHQSMSSLDTISTIQILYKLYQVTNETDFWNHMSIYANKIT